MSRSGEKSREEMESLGREGGREGVNDGLSPWVHLAVPAGETRGGGQEAEGRLPGDPLELLLPGQGQLPGAVRQDVLLALLLVQGCSKVQQLPPPALC